MRSSPHSIATGLLAQGCRCLLQGHKCDTDGDMGPGGVQAVHDMKSEEIGPGIYRFKAEMGAHMPINGIDCAGWEAGRCVHSALGSSCAGL